MKHVLNSIAALVLLLAFGAAARADLAPPETAPCQGLQAGAACTFDNTAGTCQNQTCVSLHGSYDCIECITATGTGTRTATLTKTDGGEPPATGNGACSIGELAGVRRVAPWLVAGAFSLLFIARRRRR
jgi:hypothetical protein